MIIHKFTGVTPEFNVGVNNVGIQNVGGDLVASPKGPYWDACDHIAYDWRLNGTSIALLNVPMEDGGEDITTHGYTVGLTTAVTPGSGSGSFAGNKNHAVFAANSGYEYGTDLFTGEGNITTIISATVANGAGGLDMMIAQSVGPTHTAPFYRYAFFVNAATAARTINFRMDNNTDNSPNGVYDKNGTAYNFFLEKNGTATEFRVDGTSQGTGTAPNLITAGQPTSIGSRNTSGQAAEAFNGNIGYVYSMNRIPSVAYRNQLTGSTLPDLSIIPAAETNPAENWNCRIIGYKNNVKLFDQISNIITT